MKNLILATLIILCARVKAEAQQPPVLSTAPVTAASTAAACECSRCIAVYGDSRSNHDIHARIAALILARRPRAVFHTGDMVTTGSNQKEWRKFSEITKGLRESASFYAVLGNHEKGGEKTFRDIFSFPGDGLWQSVSFSGVRFLLLDYTAPLEKGSGQFSWLEAQLKFPLAADKFSAIVVHRPLYSSGRHWDEKWKAGKDLEALLRKYKAGLVLAGHDHDYERLEKDGLVTVVTGGGGADLKPMGGRSRYSRFFAEANNYVMLSVCGSTLKGETFDIGDKLLDSFELAAGPVGTAGTEEGLRR